jgi:hypothetical protein
VKRLAVVALLLALVALAARFGPTLYSGAAAQDAPPRSPAEDDQHSAIGRAFDEATETYRQSRPADAGAPAAPKPGAAKADGKPAAPPALAKAGRPAPKKAEPAPLMVGPDGVVYEPVEAPDGRAR